MLATSIYFCLFFFLLPISLGIIFSYFLYPIVVFFNKRCHIPHFLSILIVLAAMIFLSIKCFLIFLQLSITLAPFIVDQLITIQKLVEHYPIVNMLIDQIKLYLQDNLGSFISHLQTSLSSLFKLLLFFFTFVLSLNESKNNRLWFFVFTPKFLRSKWQRYFIKISEVMKSFFIVELVLFSTTCSILIILFYLLNIPYFFHIALLVSIADLLPLLGLGVFFIPMAIYYAAIQKLNLAIIFVIIYISLIIIRQLIESKLWASSFQIRMIHSFLIGAASILLFGIYGVIASPILILLANKIRQTSIFGK